MMGAKRTPTSFSPATLTNVGIIPQTLLTFSFNRFSILMQNFKDIPSASSKLSKLNHVHPSKKLLFSGQVLKILRIK